MLSDKIKFHMIKCKMDISDGISKNRVNVKVEVPDGIYCSGGGFIYCPHCELIGGTAICRLFPGTQFTILEKVVINDNTHDKIVTYRKCESCILNTISKSE